MFPCHDVTAAQAYDYLSSDQDAVLVDVRTMQEWKEVGVPKSVKSIFLEWRLHPMMELNDNFLQELIKLIPDKKQKIFFICRTGRRSCEAANALGKLGYEACFNVLDGFEGHMNNGWKNISLPWGQYE